MKILLAIDFSDAADFGETTEKIISKAEDLAKALAASVWVLHVASPEPDFIGYERGPQSVRDSVAKQFHREHNQVQEISERLRQKGLTATGLLVEGATAAIILKEAEKLKADMIIMGSHGKGMVAKLFVGSTSQGVLHKARCPVLIVPTARA